MIFLQNCEDIAPWSEAIWKSWIFVYDLILPAPLCPPPWKFLGSSHQVPRPPAVRRTHSFLHLFLGALHHLIPSTGFTNSVAHWTSEKVVSAWFSYLDIVGCDSWREWSSLLQLSLLPVANLYTWIILSGSFWQEVVQWLIIELANCSNYIHPVLVLASRLDSGIASGS